MGFYGNITDASKTTFSFDYIYSTRYAMDEAVESDGIFLGRYVLVDYDDAPIKAYGKKDENGVVIAFYNTPHFAQNTRIEPKVGFIYEDLHIETNTVSKFYKWNGASFINLGTDKTPYYESFELDVQKYGRGYDSTVWVKRFDVQTNKYKYAMIAELNAVVPTLHLVVNEPNPTPATPYFDRDTTNIDYYMHMQGGYGNRVKKIANNEIRSDEQVVFNSGRWETDNTGYSVWVENAPQIVDGDIYYNNAGFDPAIRTYSQGQVVYNLENDQGELIPNEDGVGNKTAIADYTKNQIGFDFGRSGRYYGANADLGVYSDGHQADDIYDWFIRLPGIGNAICKMWDKVYGYRDDNKRHLNNALTYHDTADNLVTYDPSTFAGVINTVRDLIGYHFISLDEYTPKEIVTSVDDTITVNLPYENGIAAGTATYKILDCIFYNSNNEYFAYRYSPSYGSPVSPDFTDGKTYYYKKDNLFHVANPAAYMAKDANGNIIPVTSEYYLETPKWTIAPIEGIVDNNLYSLIAHIHTMLGTNIGDVRDMTSVQGAINAMKDVIANIDTNLVPGKLLHTNDSGIIEITETYFPSATWDADEVLAGDGSWVSRFASVKVRENSDNSNRKVEKVVEFETTGETTGAGPAKLLNQFAELVSDNQRVPEGYKQEHDPNTLILATRDKWIKLHPDAIDDSIEFEHTQSELVNRLSYQDYATLEEKAIEGPAAGINSNVNTANFKANEDGTELTIVSDSDIALLYADTEYDSNDNRLTIPYIVVDNAGHVVSAGTKNYNIPNSFKKISTSTIEDTNENESLDQAGISIAEEINDTLHLSSRNRWIDIATETTNNNEGDEEDTITWSHRLAPIEHFKTDVVLNGERRTSEDEIPTVYRYGLPADKNISTLDNVNGNEATNTFNIPYIEIDKAGHVVAAETHTVELPENFTTVTLKPQNESTNTEAHTVTSEDAVLAADTLTDNLTLKTVNRWIGIGLDPEADEITFGHRLSDIKDVVPAELNGERRANTKYAKVYRYGLEASKDIAALDEAKGLEAANTFNVPYVEIDEAGHVVYAETNTVEIPHGFAKVTVGSASTSVGTGTTTGTAGLTSDDLAKAMVMDAETLQESLTINPLNKWIRISGDNTKGADTIGIGHEIHNIIGSTSAEDLNGSKKDTFTTQTVEWDNAGHIVSHDTKTWTLPDSIHDIEVAAPAANTAVADLEGQKGTLVADDTFAKMILKPANIWMKLAADADNDTVSFGHLVRDIESKTGSADLNNNGTFETYDFTYDEAGHITSKTVNTIKIPLMDSGNKWIVKEDADNKTTFAHMLQAEGTAKAYGTNVEITEFGGSVDLQGYTTDEAGHIVDYPTYSLTIPKGSYSEEEDNSANVITSLAFVDTTGALTATKANIGNLLLTDYTLDESVAEIDSTDSLNAALSKLQAQIKQINWLANYSSFDELYAAIAERIETEYGIAKLSEIK